MAFMIPYIVDSDSSNDYQKIETRPLNINDEYTMTMMMKPAACNSYSYARYYELAGGYYNRGRSLNGVSSCGTIDNTSTYACFDGSSCGYYNDDTIYIFIIETNDNTSYPLAPSIFIYDRKTGDTMMMNAGVSSHAVAYKSYGTVYTEGAMIPVFGTDTFITIGENGFFLNNYTAGDTTKICDFTTNFSARSEYKWISNETHELFLIADKVLYKFDVKSGSFTQIITNADNSFRLILNNRYILSTYGKRSHRYDGYGDSYPYVIPVDNPTKKYRLPYGFDSLYQYCIFDNIYGVFDKYGTIYQLFRITGIDISEEDSTANLKLQPIGSSLVSSILTSYEEAATNIDNNNELCGNYVITNEVNTYSKNHEKVPYFPFCQCMTKTNAVLHLCESDLEKYSFPGSTTHSDFVEVIY